VKGVPVPDFLCLTSQGARVSGNGVAKHSRGLNPRKSTCLGLGRSHLSSHGCNLEHGRRALIQAVRAKAERSKKQKYVVYE
jgi:hypothetical protein